MADNNTIQDRFIAMRSVSGRTWPTIIWSLVYDIADFFKFDGVVPEAFRA